MLGRTNTGGGGSGGLNFQVIGGTTAPSNPKENMIWVNTDTPITSWIFSATEPSPAEAGMVWIFTGTSSTVEFNALKKNGIQVYPISAKQYVNGTWVEVVAKSYQNGEWKGWNLYIFKSGEGENIPLYSSVEKTNNVSVTIDNEKIHVDAKASAESMSRIGTSVPVDITNYGLLKIEVQGTYRGGANYISTQGFVFGISANKLVWGTGDNNKYAAKLFVSSSDFSGTHSLDISSLAGEYYISFGGYIDADVYNWWLE